MAQGEQSVQHFQLKQRCSAPGDGRNLCLSSSPALQILCGDRGGLPQVPWVSAGREMAQGSDREMALGKGTGKRHWEMARGNGTGKWPREMALGTGPGKCAVPALPDPGRAEPRQGCPAVPPAPLPAPHPGLSSCCLLERSQPRPGRGAERGAFITPSDLISQYSPLLAANCSRAHLLSQMGTASTLGLAFRFPLMR